MMNVLMKYQKYRVLIKNLENFGERIMGTIYGDKRFRKNPSLANTPDGQTTIGDIPEMPDRKRSVNDNDEKIRQMISTTRPGELGIVCLNVGQGDATIVRLPNGKLMVVDCNVDNSPENLVKYLKDAESKKLITLLLRILTRII